MATIEKCDVTGAEYDRGTSTIKVVEERATGDDVIVKMDYGPHADEDAIIDHLTERLREEGLGHPDWWYDPDRRGRTRKVPTSRLEWIKSFIGLSSDPNA